MRGTTLDLTLHASSPGFVCGLCVNSRHAAFLRSESHFKKSPELVRSQGPPRCGQVGHGVGGRRPRLATDTC